MVGIDLEGCSLLQPGTNNGLIFGACFCRQPKVSIDQCSADGADALLLQGI